MIVEGLLAFCVEHSLAVTEAFQIEHSELQIISVAKELVDCERLCFSRESSTHEAKLPLPLRIYCASLVLCSSCCLLVFFFLGFFSFSFSVSSRSLIGVFFFVFVLYFPCFILGFVLVFSCVRLEFVVYSSCVPLGSSCVILLCSAHVLPVLFLFYSCMFLSCSWFLLVLVSRYYRVLSLCYFCVLPLLFLSSSRVLLVFFCTRFVGILSLS